MTFEIGLAFAILVGAFGLFLWGRFSIDFVAILVMAVILVLGPILDVEPEEAISGFSSPATITVLFVFVLSEAVQRTGLINIISQWMIRWAGRGERRQILTVGAAVGPISAFINNAAAVAILIPAVIRMAGEAGRPASKFLLPLSYASQIAGVITLIGTSTNILASVLTARAGYEPFGMFEFSLIGLLVFATGGLYLIVIAPRLLPNREPERAQVGAAEEADLQVLAAVVEDDSDLVGKTVVTSGFRQRYQCTVVAIRHDGELLQQGLRDIEIQPGDILVLEGPQESLNRMRSVPGLIVVDQFRLQTLEVVIGPNSDLVGGTLVDANFRNRYRATVVAIRKQGRMIRENLGQVRLEFGDSLLIEGTETVFEQLKDDPNFIVIEEREIGRLRTEKIPFAVLILGGVVIAAALGYSILISVIVGSVLMVLTGCLRVRELRESIRWDVVFLLAGMIPLGLMLERTGGARLLADLATDAGTQLPAIGTLFIFYVVSSLLAAVISNNGAVVLMVPVGIAAANSLGMDPRALVLAIMFAASTNFMTPMSYQTNIMVYGPGGYTFGDYFKAGAPLNLLLAVTTPIYILLIWGV